MVWSSDADSPVGAESWQIILGSLGGRLTFKEWRGAPRSTAHGEWRVLSNSAVGQYRRVGNH